MKRLLLPLALVCALAVPVGAQFGWFSLNGGLIARMSSATTAVTIKQEGTGAFLDLGKGSNTYRFAPSGTSLLLQASTGGAFSTVGTFTSGGTFATPGAVSISSDVLVPNASTMYWADRARMRSSADGVWSVRNSAESNTYDITLADWGTTVTPEGNSVANAGLLYLGAAPTGMLTVESVSDTLADIFLLRGATATLKVTAVSGTLTATKDTAASINVYYDGAGPSGAGVYVQNNRGVTRTIRLHLIGA